jgi:membrane fusion protein, multidrug efflux system
MKKIATLVLFVAAIACKPSADTDLVRLTKDKDSLTTLKDHINSKLLEIEEKLAKLDTTRRLTLVTTIPATKDTFSHFVSVLGEVKTDQNILLYPEIAGLIRSIEVSTGQKVQKGQVLARLDSEVLQNSINEIKVQTELAKTVFDKRAKLWEQKIGSEIEYLQSKSNYEGLLSRMASLQSQQEMSVIRAPFTGTVDDVSAKVGEMAMPQIPLLRILSLDKVYLEADVPESYLSTLKKGTPVEVEFAQMGIKRNSTISQVGNFIKAENRTFRVRVDMSESKDLLKPNLMANIHIVDYTNPMAISVPNHVIQQSPDGRSFVFVFTESGEKSEGMVSKTFVKTGYSFDGSTEVVEGLMGSELIIDKGARSVTDKQKVQQSI